MVYHGYSISRFPSQIYSSGLNVRRAGRPSSPCSTRQRASAQQAPLFLAIPRISGTSQKLACPSLAGESPAWAEGWWFAAQGNQRVLSDRSPDGTARCWHGPNPSPWGLPGEPGHLGAGRWWSPCTGSCTPLFLALYCCEDVPRLAPPLTC